MSSLLLLKFTISCLIHFYCCKRLLGRNNTVTTSASASSYRLCWCLPDNWLTLAKTLHHDTATINSEFIFSNLADQFKTSGRTWDSRLFLLFFWSPFVMHFSQPMPSCQVTCLRNNSLGNIHPVFIHQIIGSCKLSASPLSRHAGQDCANLEVTAQCSRPVYKAISTSAQQLATAAPAGILQQQRCRLLRPHQRSGTLPLSPAVR